MQERERSCKSLLVFSCSVGCNSRPTTQPCSLYQTDKFTAETQSSQRLYLNSALRVLSASAVNNSKYSSENVLPSSAASRKPLLHVKTRLALGHVVERFRMNQLAAVEHHA